MVASVNASNSYIAQSEKSQNNSSAKSKPLSSKSANDNQFVKKPENKPSGFNLDTSYKLELSESSVTKTFSILNEGKTREKETEKTETPPVEVKTLVENKKMANESTSEINNTTLKSAVKLYTIIKNDILLDNHFDLKTGSVNFFA
jgi:hypothetical protein